MFSALGAGAYLGLHIIRQDGFEKKRRIPVILAGLAGGLFILGFFSIHFGAFHAGHSVFLNLFFPVEGMPNDGFGRAFINPPLLWILAFRHLFIPYGIFLIPTIIAEREAVFNPFIKVFQGLNAGNNGVNLFSKNETGLPEMGKNPLGSAMFRPYINVVRMHLLIFFFAFCYVLKIHSFIIYAAVYFVYFFPWSEIRKLKRSKLNNI
jgi:hypothetical protein